jgi:RarD protein
VQLSEHRWGQIAVALGALAWSTAGVFQRQLDVDTATQIAGRAVFATIALGAIVVVREKRNTISAFRQMGRFELMFAAAMASAMALFIFALNNSSVASVLFMQALAPFVAVVLAWFVLRERATKRTWLATVVAVAGVAVMAGSPGGGSAIGLAAAFGMTLCFGATIVIVRHQRDISMAPAMVLSQLLVLAAFAPFAAPTSITGHDLVFLVLLGFGQQGLGQMFFGIGGRLIPATQVAIITLLEVIGGPLWVWLAYSEQPPTSTLIGGAIVLAAIVVQATDPGEAGMQALEVDAGAEVALAMGPR